MGDPVSVDTTGLFGMTLANAFDTTYDGATVLLTTNAPIAVDGSGNVTMVFSIMDLGDSIYDSTAFLDNFRWGDAECEPVTQTPPPTATPTTTTPASPTPSPPPPGAEPYGLVWVYHSEADNGTPGCVSDEGPCGISGSAGDAINLYIDGGSDGGGEGETVCGFGAGAALDNLCGADLLIEMVNGHFTGIEPTIDTLMCNPSCADCDADETGICSLPVDTTRIRMNFRRGGDAPPVGHRRVATLIFDSSDDGAETPTRVLANGIAAAGANLQLRPIANVVSACTGAGEPFSCCTGVETSANGRWPCGPRLIVPTRFAPEPGQLLQLVSGLAGLGCLYRLRRRA